MDKESVDLLLKSASFQFAKSMAYIPHWYTLATKWGSRKNFEDVVQFIRDHGVDEKFGKRTFTYYYLDGYKYWTMGSPLDKTKLINKAKV